MNSDLLYISLDAPPALEEILADWLMEFDPNQRFSSYTVNDHNGDHTKFSLKEQVTGRQKQVRFELYLEKDRYRQFLDKFKANFKGSGIQFRVMSALGQDVL